MESAPSGRLETAARAFLDGGLLSFLRSPRLHLPVLVGASVLILFVNLDSHNMKLADETIHTLVAREVARTGEFWHLRLRGEPYYEKPPLKIWLSALTFATLGQDEFWVRFWDAAFALAVVLILYRWGSRIGGPEIGLLSATLLLFNPQYVFDHNARSGVQDSAMNCLIVAALYLFWTREKPGRLLLAGAACGLASLTKNAIGIVPLGIMGLWLILEGKLREAFGRRFLLAVLLAIVIPALWFIPQILLDPEFAKVSFGHNVLGRISGQRHSDHVQPWTYYIPSIAAGTWPWAMLVPPLLAWAFWRVVRGPDRRVGFFLVWFGIFFAAFSTVRLKLPWYVHPMFPPLAVILAWSIADCLRAARRLPGPLAPLSTAAGAIVVAGMLVRSFAGQAERLSKYHEPAEVRQLAEYLETLKEPFDFFLLAKPGLGDQYHDQLNRQEDYYLGRVDGGIRVAKPNKVRRAVESGRPVFVVVERSYAASVPVLELAPYRMEMPSLEGGKHDKEVFVFHHEPPASAPFGKIVRARRSPDAERAGSVDPSPPVLAAAAGSPGEAAPGDPE